MNIINKTIFVAIKDFDLFLFYNLWSNTIIFKWLRHIIYIWIAMVKKKHFKIHYEFFLNIFKRCKYRFEYVNLWLSMILFMQNLTSVIITNLSR